MLLAPPVDTHPLAPRLLGRLKLEPLPLFLRRGSVTPKRRESEFAFVLARGLTFRKVPSLRPILMNTRVIFGDAVLSNRCELEAETWWSLASH